MQLIVLLFLLSLNNVLLELAFANDEYGTYKVSKSEVISLDVKKGKRKSLS